MFTSVHQNLSLASDMSDAMEDHIGHFSSYIGHFTYQMINNVTGHRTLCPTSSATISDIQDETSDMSDVSDGFWVTLCPMKPFCKNANSCYNTRNAHVDL